MTDTVSITRARVTELAAELGIPAEHDAAGDLVVRLDSTTAFVQVSAEPDGRAVIEGARNVDAPITPDLQRFVAETSFMFGRLVVEPMADGTGQVVLSHALLGDPLTPDVLLQAIGTIANTAERLDDDLVDRFGGRRFHDPGLLAE
jgi:hypothetical protein